MRKQLLFLSLFLLTFYSCKKENEVKESAPGITKGESGMLNFKSSEDFKNLITTLSEKDEKDLQQNVSQFTGVPNFVSFAVSQRVNAENPKSSTLLSTMSEQEDTPEEPFEELVPDPYFASILNDKLEVEVENVIYKVTPFGTFIIAPEKYSRLLEILDQNPYAKGQDLTGHKFYSNKMHDDFYKIEDKIILLDTYKRAEGKEIEVNKTQVYSVKSTPATISSGTGTDDYIYDNLPTINFGAKTVVGKLFESLRGREEIYTENFEKKRRVRVNFYNASWGVYSAIGASVKFQKKNWIGWSGTEAPELRLGWDALEYYCGDLPAGPLIPQQPTYPQQFTPVDLPKVTKQYVEVDLLGYSYTFDKNEAIQKGIKKVYDFAKTIPGIYPKTQNVNYAFKVWSDVTKRSISIVQERDEQIAYNAESISKQFDWAVGIKVSTNFENISFGYAPLDFSLERASVFGIVKYGTAWKGARIVAE